jgi:hypothetical protein
MGRPAWPGECRWVAVLAERHNGQIVAGAILTCGPAVGLSNFFTRPGAGPQSWQGCLALAGLLFPGKTLVGCASGSELTHAQRHGFERVGHLRVWLNDTSPPA